MALQWWIGAREGGWIRVTARGAVTERWARLALWAAGSGTQRRRGGAVAAQAEWVCGRQREFGRWAMPDLTLGRTVAAGQARLTDFPNLFQYFNYSELAKYKNYNSSYLKISKLGQVIDRFKMNIFPFGKRFKFSTQFEWKIQGLNYFWILFEI
jgi:hypothetical protein